MEHKNALAKPFASDRSALLNGLAYATAFVPGLGDLAGLAADAGMYADDPKSRNWKNGLLSLAALLPGVPARVFHGTGRDFADFALDAQKTTGGGFNKYGVSVTEDPRVASRYATDFFQSGQNVRPLDVTVQKPMTLTAMEFEKLQSLVSKIDSGEALSELEDIGLEMLLKKHGAQYGGHPIDAIKSAGFDAIQKDAGRHGMAETEALIFDPSMLRPGFGSPR
jgi:hypothetical protein